MINILSFSKKINILIILIIILIIYLIYKNKIINTFVINNLEYIDNVIDYVLINKYTFLEKSALKLHISIIKKIEELGLKGIMIECGTANGGTAIISTAVKNKQRKFLLFDTFEGMPSPTKNDDSDVHSRYKIIKSGKAGKNYYGYNKNLLNDVKKRFKTINLDYKENNVEFYKGLFQNTLNINTSVVYLHLDADWYESTMYPLKKVVPHIVKNGFIIIDDYKAFSGCRKATNNFWNINKKDENLLRKKKILIREKFNKKWLITMKERLVIQALT